MGGHRFSADDWTLYSSTTSTRSVSEIYTSSHINENLDPKNIKMRESRDSDANPNSTALIVALDVTGSMGSIAHYMAQTGLGVLFKEIYDRVPIPDPHIMAMGVGDARFDRSPLQVTQFEAGVAEITSQLEKIHVEGGGGGNSTESYELPWLFAGTHTSIDCFEKRGKRGYLFTIGDEEVPTGASLACLKRVFGDTRFERDYTAEECLQLASKYYNVFHILVEEGNHARYNPDRVADTWTPLLGQRLIRLSNYKSLAEVIVSAIQVVEGEDAAKVCASWGATKSAVVRKAVNALVPAPKNNLAHANAKGVVSF